MAEKQTRERHKLVRMRRLEGAGVIYKQRPGSIGLDPAALLRKGNVTDELLKKVGCRNL
jgi:hypothetical protein